MPSIDVAQPRTAFFRRGAIAKLPERLFATCVASALSAAVSLSAHTQVVMPVPCYAFQQDALGNWIATEPVTVDLRNGTIDIMPGHQVSVPVANILNARCPE